MIFIPNGPFIALSLTPDLVYEALFNLTPGEIYLVLEYVSAESANHSDDEHRSLILHPVRGPCKTFVCLERGQIVRSDGCDFVKIVNEDNYYNE
jgi:hypothetical protein